MTNREDVPALIAEARDVLSRPIRADHESEEARGVIQRLADALEAERELVDELNRMHRECHDQRDALAAVVEKAEDHLTRHYLDMRFADEVLPILASAPTDALREVKAAAWGEGFDVGSSHGIAFQAGNNSALPAYNANPYRRIREGKGE